MLYKNAHEYREAKLVLYRSHRWVQLAKRHKRTMLGSTCYVCKSRGIERGAEETDHVISAQYERGDTLDHFYDEDNLAGICKPCHVMVTSKEKAIQHSMRGLVSYEDGVRDKLVCKIICIFADLPFIGVDGWRENPDVRWIDDVCECEITV